MGQDEQDHLKLLKFFPRLDSCTWRITSPDQLEYNCVAWAAQDNTRWWDPIKPFYWPPGAPRSYALMAFQSAFQSLGYEPCESRESEVGYEKIAFYVLGGNVEHVARQLLDGSWTSKLGYLHDIEHSTLEALEGEDYGTVALIMRRHNPRTAG